MTVTSHRTPAHRKVREIPMAQIVTALAGLVLAFAMVAGIIAITDSLPYAGSSPAACHSPDLPSGDAMRTGTAERVCTDGTWVHVSGYGN
jgi:hypothetical protein